MDLKSIRKNRGYGTLHLAANAVGISPASLSRIERGINLPSAKTAERLGKLYRLPVQEIWQMSYDCRKQNGAP